MFENSFEKQKLEKEQLIVNIDVATEDDVEAYKKLMQSITTREDMYMLGISDSKLNEIKNGKYNFEKDLVPSDNKFVLLAFDESDEESLKNKNPDAIGTISAVELKKGVWLIYSSYVHPDFRNMKAGTAILATCLDQIKIKKGILAKMDVKDTNKYQLKLADEFLFGKKHSIFRSEYNLTKDLTDERLIKKINEVLNAG